MPFLHGALKTQNGKIVIDYLKHGNYVKIKISDNGKATKLPGLSSSKLNRSMSMDITKKRIKNLFEVYKLDILFTPVNPDKNGINNYTAFDIPLEI